VFTGIVEEVGTVRDVMKLENGLRFEIGAERVMQDLGIGDSIAVEGVCQTVVARTADTFTIEAIATTLSRTTMGSLEPGSAVNLERAMALGERIGGHLVQGHVDAVGEVVAVRRQGEHVLLDVRMPADVAEVTVLHGSIAIQGVSLTVNALPTDGVVQVALIPFTWDHTTLSGLEPGAHVNLEGDMLGKFVIHSLKQRGRAGV